MREYPGLFNLSATLATDCAFDCQSIIENAMASPVVLDNHVGVVKLRCEHCGNKWVEDSRGCCSSCGAPS